VGNLTPEKTIVYERNGDTIYARYEGDPANKRWAVGEYKPVKDKKG